MNLLQLLQVGVSLFPAVLPLKCFTEQHTQNGCLVDPNIPTDQCSMQCDRETHCMMKTGSSVTHGNFTIRGCAQPEACSADGCKFIIENGAPVQICCCKTDLCNKLSKFDSNKKLLAIYAAGWKIGQEQKMQATSTWAPSLDAVECFAEQRTERGGLMSPEIPTNKLSMMCNHYEHCMVKSGRNAVHGNFTLRGCAPSGSCIYEGCRSITENGSLVDVCCCKGNFCNTRSIWKSYKDQQRSYLEDLHAKGMALLPALRNEPRAPSRHESRRKLNPFAKHSSRVDHESRIGGRKYKNLLRQTQKSTTVAATTSTKAAPVWDLPLNGHYLIDYRQFQTTSSVAPTPTSTSRVSDEPYELGRVNQAGPVDLLLPSQTTAVATSEIKCYGQQQSQRGPLIHSGIPRTWSKISCSDVTHCMKAHADDSSQFGRITLYGCAPKGYCSFEGCDWVNDKDIGKIHLCCCRGNYCNPASTSTMLLSISTVAAVFAINLY